METTPNEPPITEYERAVCYYSLPRVTSTVTIGLVAAYAVCFIEAVAVLVFGVIRGEPVWIEWGTIALAAIIVLGVVAFLLRAFLNDVRRRRLLQPKMEIPLTDSGFDDLPDPFTGNILLRFHETHRRKTFIIDDNTGHPQYEVTPKGYAHKTVRNCATDETFSIQLKHRGVAFYLDKGAAANVIIRRGKETIGIARERFHLVKRLHEIESQGLNYTVRDGAIIYNEQTIGRTYALRGLQCLDIQEEHLNPGTLAYFIVFA